MGRGWAFEHSNLKLQRGMILDSGSLDVVRHSLRTRYDVFACFGAERGMAAPDRATISGTNGAVDANATAYYYKLGWMKVNSLPSEATNWKV